MVHPTLVTEAAKQGVSPLPHAKCELSKHRRVHYLRIAVGTGLGFE